MVATIPLLWPAVAKVQWAGSLRKWLLSMLQAHIENGGAKVVNRFNEEQQRYHLVLETELLPVSVGLAFGDVIHNLRSALDTAISMLVAEASNGVHDSRVNFPIAEKEEHYRRSFTGKGPHAILRKTFPDLEDVIATNFKPWVEGLDGSKGNEALFALSRLDNLAKHRIILVVFGRFGFHGFDFTTAENVMHAFNSFVIGPGQELPIAGSREPIKVTQGDISAEMIVAQDQPFAGEEMFELIDKLGGMTLGILEALEAYFDGSQAAPNS